jgi:hypothetical protein
VFEYYRLSNIKSVGIISFPAFFLNFQQSMLRLFDTFCLDTGDSSSFLPGMTACLKEPIPSPDAVGGHPSLFQQGKASSTRRFTRSVFKDQVGRKKHPFPFIVREGPSGHRTGAGGWVRKHILLSKLDNFYAKLAGSYKPFPSPFLFSGMGRPVWPKDRGWGWGLLQFPYSTLHYEKFIGGAYYLNKTSFRVSVNP